MFPPMGAAAALRRRPVTVAAVAALCTLVTIALSTVLSLTNQLPAEGAAAVPAGAKIGLAVTPSSGAYPAGAAPLLHLRLTNLMQDACGLAATPDLTLSVV